METTNSARQRLVLSFLCLFFSARALAQNQSNDKAGELPSQAAIGQVRILGNQTIPANKILKQVRSRPGAAFDAELVSDDARRIMLMPQVRDVHWRVMPVGEQVDIVFEVSETPRVESVAFLGNKNIKTKTLAKELQFAKGDALDRFQINQGRDALAKAYHDKGYYFAEVNLNEKLLKETGKVVYVIEEGPKLRIRKRNFVGNEAVKTGKLKGKVKTNSYFPIFRKGRLDDDNLKQDTLALARYYHDEGYLDAQVFAEKQFNEDKTRVTVDFVISEGPRYRVASLRFDVTSLPSAKKGRFSAEELADAADLAQGDVFTRERQIQAERSVKRLYGKEGYIFAQVKVMPEFTDEAGEVLVVVKIEENGSFKLGRLIVRGNYETQDKVVRRLFDHYDFLPGGIYDTEAAERARKRLLGGGLFESAEVRPIGALADERDALVEVKEARTGMILFGVGVDTNSGVMGNFMIEQRNFDASRPPKSLGELLRGEAFKGGGQRLRLSFSPGTRVTTGHINFHEPYLFDQPYYLDLDAFLFRRWRESYLERRRGGMVMLGHRFENDWSAEVSLRLEEIKVTDLDTNPDAPVDVQDVRGSNFLTSAKFGIGRNTTDNIFRPSQGYKVNAGWEQVGVLGGYFSFAALSAGGSIYHAIYEDITERKTVLAGHVGGRNIIGDAPVFERYYAGGIGSIRGFDYRGVSPRAGADDDPIGSDYLVEAGAELTHPLHEEVIFGKIFFDTALISEGPYRMTVGFGLELLVPQLFQMIPMHFDFGFPIASDEKDDQEVFSFSFGMSF